MNTCDKCGCNLNDSKCPQCSLPEGFDSKTSAKNLVESIASYLKSAGWEMDRMFRWKDPKTGTSHYTITALDVQLDRDLGAELPSNK